MDGDLERTVEQAKNGDKAALEAVVRAIEDKVYGLAMRMLADPADAQDASQEILIRVVTNLASFRGESAFTTWVYRVASNHLLTTKKRKLESTELSFEALGRMIDGGLAEANEPSTDPVLSEEVRIACTEGMLLSLDREHRLAYVLGEILELDGDQAAAILEIAPPAFRKRLSRARERIVEFMKGRCGVYDANNRCRCAIQVPYAMRTGMLDPCAIRFATHARRMADERAEERRELLGLLDAAAIFKSHPDYAAPEALSEGLRRALKAGES
jgi:RNA polymerase sigma factor (sigma-70 family)